MADLRGDAGLHGFMHLLEEEIAHVQLDPGRPGDPCRVEGLGFRVWGFGFRVQGLGCRI